MCFQEKPSPGLTASGSSPLEGNSPSPNATPNSLRTESITTTTAPVPSKLSTTAGTLTSSLSSEPPAKKTKTAKITAEEKAAKEAERAKKKLEKEDAERQKAAERARRQAEKLEKEEAAKKKAAEKAEKQAEKEEAEKRKAAEKAKKQAEKLEKEETAKKKAVEKAEKLAQAEKDKASQRKIFDMFRKPGPSTPKKAPPVTNLLKHDSDKTATSPLRTEIKPPSQYLQHFKPFYVKDQVTLADQSFGIDKETREAKANIILEFLEGKREFEPSPLKDNALEILQVPFRRRRGRVYPSVRKLMSGYQGAASLPTDLTSDSQKTQICHTREALQAVPLKCLKFREDVRPPYIGTISGLPEGTKSLRSIALHPNSKAVPSLNYDYDSEAEWQEEDGEDVEDLDDEEDEVDNDEEMDDFLDDSEDVGPARLVFSGGMEPESTGLCWENRKRLSSPAKMYKFRMEFILGKRVVGMKAAGYGTLTSAESLPHHSGIDPFSSSYWNEPSKPEPKASSPAASSPPVSAATESKMAPPPGPSDAFSAIIAPKKKSAGATKKQLQPLPDEYHQKLKALLIEKPQTSKVGLIEWFAGENPNCVKNQIKVSFELLTEKPDTRTKGSNAWKLRKDA